MSVESSAGKRQQARLRVELGPGVGGVVGQAKRTGGAAVLPTERVGARSVQGCESPTEHGIVDSGSTARLDPFERQKRQGVVRDGEHGGNWERVRRPEPHEVTCFTTEEPIGWRRVGLREDDAPVVEIKSVRRCVVTAGQSSNPAGSSAECRSQSVGEIVHVATLCHQARRP